MMLVNNELAHTASLLLEQLARFDARDQKNILALLRRPENFGERTGARDYWIRGYGGILRDMAAPAKARKMETDWNRYLASARWQIDRKFILLPLETEFPFWHLHVISTLNLEESLGWKRILGIIR